MRRWGSIEGVGWIGRGEGGRAVGMRGRGTRRVERGRPEFKEENEIIEVVKIPTIYTPGLNRGYWHEGIRVASLPSFPFEALFYGF